MAGKYINKHTAPLVDNSPVASIFRQKRLRFERKWGAGVMAGTWLLACFLLTGCHGYEMQKFAMEPLDQNAIVGSRVTLPCRVVHKAGALQWTKDDFGLGTQRNLSGYERYQMVGTDEEGDYSLDIRDVHLEDDGRYQCQVSSGLNGEPPIRSRYAQLTVLVAPEPPRITQGAFIDATEGQSVDIECVSHGGRPAAEITWVSSNQTVIKTNVENKIEPTANGHTFISRSVLRLTPGKQHHNQTLTCQAQNTADRAYRMATVHIEVRYAPKVSVFLKSSAKDGLIREGTEARFGCKVDANPTPQLYRWYLNGTPVIGDYADEMIIFNVTRKHNNAEVKCEVSNTVGKNEDSMKIKVTYPPSFRSRPMNVEADVGARVTLDCAVDGQPAPEVRWLLHEPGRIGQVKGKTSSLKITVNNDTAGRYICKASVEGYPEIESEASVMIKGTPRILSSKTQLGSEGETIRVECLSISVPKPDDIRWYFEGNEISAILNPDYATLEEILTDGYVKSSLVIRASKYEHFGHYNCSVTNEYGNANTVILLKPIKTLPLFIILTGATSGIIIISAFIALLVLCLRKRRKNQRVNEKPDVTNTSGDMYKDSDRSSNISDLKPHLPNSDGTYDLDYTSSDSSSKMPGGLPLAGPVPLRLRREDPLLHFRYSNDYSDPAFSDAYLKSAGLGAYLYDYQGYPPPPTLRVQSPTEHPGANRSLQGSLTRSIDTTSTLALSASQSNSLQRSSKQVDETDAINSLGLPLANDSAPAPMFANNHPNVKTNGVDVRFAATYGNPYLRNSSLGLAGPVHPSKAGSQAPPPYSLRGSVVVPGNASSTQPAHATHV